MRKTFDRRVVPDSVLAFVRACQRRIPCHLGGGAALAGAYLGHRMTGDIDLFVHDGEDMRALVGFLPDAERDNCFAAADAYLQPSAHEAFSRTVMEAWLAGTPVIASAAGAVVKWHCERSGAGLTYEDDWELEQCLCFVADAPDAARELAAPGRDYVLEHYEFDAVADRIDGALLGWTSASLGRASCAS